MYIVLNVRCTYTLVNIAFDDMGCRSGRCSDERSAHHQHAEPLARLALPAARAPPPAAAARALRRAHLAAAEGRGGHEQRAARGQRPAEHQRCQTRGLTL